MTFDGLKKIILITHNDLSIQAGDVTLICRRAEEMYKHFGASTECIVTRHFPKPSHVVEGIFFKVIESKKELIKEVRIVAPDLIVIYGISSFTKILLLRKNGFKGKIYLDIQGVPEELIDCKTGIGRFKVYPKFLVKKMMLKEALKKSDGAFVVTDELKQYCTDLSGYKKKFDYVKIRCGLQTILDISTKVENRKSIRELLKIKESATVFVFSGYRKPWQKIDRIIEIFEYIDKNFIDPFFCFFCNTDDQFEKMLENKFPKNNFCVEFLPFTQYYSYLCACDVGFLVRSYSTTNKVAFPNKFSDYLTCGLVVSMNDAVCEPFRILANYDFPIVNCNDVNDDFMVAITKAVEIRKENLSNYYKKADYICEEELTYERQLLNQNVS